jgi:RHS repeat-associated protein
LSEVFNLLIYFCNSSFDKFLIYTRYSWKSILWYSFNRQSTMTGPGGNVEYVYDALGRRVAKIVDHLTTYYVYHVTSQVIEERDAADQLTARYTYGAGIDEALLMERGDQTYTYHRDALGSITEVTDQSGNLVERYEYDVYGAPQFFDRTGKPLTASAIGNPILFTGRWYDAESGNYDYRARVYSPTLGRFLQMDPLGVAAGDRNLYRYAFNNPLTFTDPSGEIVPIAVLVAAIVKLASAGIDYGLTVYDIYKAGEILESPDASPSEKLLAAVTISLALGLEALEPDDWCPVNLPADDIVRRELMAGVQEAIQQRGIEGLEFYLQQKLSANMADVVMRRVRDLLAYGLEEGTSGEASLENTFVDQLTPEEMQRLFTNWDKSSYDDVVESVTDHATRKGYGDDVAKYWRKADSFNRKGATSKTYETPHGWRRRWERKNGEYVIETLSGKIVSYGFNKTN